MVTAECFGRERHDEETFTGDWIFSFSEDDLDIIVGGDGNQPNPKDVQRINLVLADRDILMQKAMKLLAGFMKDTGSWELSAVNCGGQADNLGCDFLFSFTFVADRDPYEYGYTYFDVGFVVKEQTSSTEADAHPIKFLVGFY